MRTKRALITITLSMSLAVLILGGWNSQAQDQKKNQDTPTQHGTTSPTFVKPVGPGHAQPFDAEAKTTLKGAPQVALPMAAGQLTGFVERYPLWVNLQTLMNDKRMSHVEPTVRQAIQLDFGRVRDKRSQLVPEAAGLDSDDDTLIAENSRLAEEKRNLDSELADLSRQINDHNARCNPAPDDASYQQCVANASRLNSWRDQYNNKIADYNGRLGNYQTRLNRLKQAWAGLVQSVDAWGTEIQALIDRIVKEFNKTDTGDCTAEQHRTLQDEVDQACKRPRACIGNMECPELRDNLRKNQECYNARKAINDTCYRGGDEGHKQALAEAQNAINNCLDFITKNCGAGMSAKGNLNDLCGGPGTTAQAHRGGVYSSSVSGR